MTDQVLTSSWKSLARTVPRDMKRHAWEDLASKTVDLEFVTLNATELARLLLSTLQLQFPTDIRRSIIATIHHSLKSDAFTKEFTASLVKQENSNPLPYAARALLHWSGLVLQHLDPTSAKKAMTRLIECQSSWLSSLVLSEDFRFPTHHAIGIPLRAHPELLDDYLAAIKISKAPAPLLAAVWNEIHGSTQADLVTKVVEPCLQLFLDKVLSAKDSTPSPSTLRCYAQLLEDASLDQISELLLPATLRMLKRSPESAFPQAIFMLRCLRNKDLSNTVTDVMPLLVQLVRHAKESVRLFAVEAVAAYAAHIKSEDALQECISAVQTVLEGNSDAGKIKNAQERKSLACMLEALAEAGSDTSTLRDGTTALSSLNRKFEGRKNKNSADNHIGEKDRDFTHIAESICRFISSFYKDEVTEEGKIALIKALAAWLPLCPSIPEEVILRMTDGLKEKEVLRRSHLQALALTLVNASSMQKCSQASSLMGALSSLVQEGITKASMRIDGILAMLCTACIARTDPGGYAAAVKNGLWPTAALTITGGTADEDKDEKDECFSETSLPLLSSTTAGQLTGPTDVVTLVQLVGVLLGMHEQSHPAITDALVPTLSRTLVLLLLHHSPVVREAAASAAAAVVADASPPTHASPSPATAPLTLVLLRALQYWIDRASSVTIIQDPSLGDISMPLEAVYQRYYHALLSCLPSQALPWRASSSQWTPAVVARALLLAHHPMIAGARRGGSGALVWQSIIARAVKTTAGSTEGKSSVAAIVTEIIASHAEEITQELIDGNHGIKSTSSQQRSAACAALRTATSMAASSLFEPCIAAIVPLLDRTDHDELTARQLRIYATPNGRLSNENDDGSMIPVELFEEMLMDKAAIKPPLFLPDIKAWKDGDIPSTKDSSSGPQGKATSSGKATTRPSQASSAKGKPAAGSGGAKSGKDPAAIARERQLKSELDVRNHVITLREGLTHGLDALAAFASGVPSFTVEHLDRFAAPVLQLLTSPLVGATSALQCLNQLTACISGPVGWHAMDVAASLKLIATVETEKSTALLSDRFQWIARQPCVADSIKALVCATGGTANLEEGEDGGASAVVVQGTMPLPTSVYTFCFPILRAVLSCPIPTPLHEAALAVLSLHVSKNVSASKSHAFNLLYHVLDVLPAFRDRVQTLLCTLCTSLHPDDAHSLSAALQGTIAAHAFARHAALTALATAPALSRSESSPPAACLSDVDVISLLYMARCDPSEDNAAAGKALWAAAGCSLPQDYVPSMARHLANPSPDVRSATAEALAAGMLVHPAASTIALSSVIDLYSSPQASLNGRRGAAAALAAMASRLSSSDLTTALDFLLSVGLVDPNASVRSDIVSAGVSIVDASGQEHSATMLPLFDSYLEKKVSDTGLTEEQYDHVRQGVVVFLGTLAKHLDPGSPKVKNIIGTLIEVLTTPSEAVQRAVSDRLPPLMQAQQGDADFCTDTIKRLLERALHGASYGDRRGAAYGLAGAVKGLGLSSLKGHGVTESLKAGMEAKTDANAREGALLCYECLSDKLGRLFEPYVIHILPLLLTAFGDSSPQVRDAANGAARIIMGQLSAQGVKLVLPVLLNGADDKLWRTKQGSIQLLGAMAHCAPKQLSACLPTIVPRLGQVMADPHPKVSSAAKQALDEVGSVIRNPEVSRLVPVLLKSVANPDKDNKAALNTLLTTVFVNTIDAASLALIIPVVHRGLRDRSGDIKKRAARIVGNLCALINDPKDMTPYVSLLLPELQSSLVDPLPEVRATAAKALGALTAGMGAANIGDITPWLLEKMKSEVSGVERSGAAQGLAESLAVQGSAALAEVLPTVLHSCKSPAAATREGALTLFKYLPYCMTDQFGGHLPAVLPAVLDGLADEVEGVRDAALSAGRVAVELYANTALPLLLPAVEAGATNANWRIRQSSIELLGDLLYKVAGTTGRIQQDLHDEEGEGISVESHGQAIVEALGFDKRNEILALLYLARSDVAYTVRTAALHVWKTIVTNTPKTLSEVLPSLMDQVIGCLAEEEEERRESAGRCLGELVRKMGDRVLMQILPILKAGMASPQPETRAGVCSGLCEVMENATKQQLAEHLGELLPAVQEALCDEDAAVRAAAGSVINVLFKSGGGSVVDSVIPSLLMGLEKDEDFAAKALEGLRVLLGVRPQLLSAMTPRLINSPVSSTNLRALGALAEVAGSAIHGHLPTIMPCLLSVAYDHPDVSPAASAAHAAIVSVAGSIQDDGLHVFMAEIHKGLDDPTKRRGAAAAVAAFCKETRLDYQEHVPSLLSSLVPLLTDDDSDTLQSIWNALAAVTASIPKEVAPSYVRTLKDAVSTAKERARRKHQAAGKGTAALLIAGFCLPKALSAVVPIYLQGVLQGSSSELRELAAEGLGDLVEVTSEESLKPFVVQITGPLIRIIGDRFPPETKAAILRTMGLLVDRAGVGLRPFIPQLQTTFVKCLTDPSRTVRARAARNLGGLTRMALRLDQLISDLASSLGQADVVVKDSYLLALEGSLKESGERLSNETLSKVGSAIIEAAIGARDNEQLLHAAADALGAYCARCNADELQTALDIGPLAPAQTGRLDERLRAVYIAAAIARSSYKQMEEAALLGPFLHSVVKLSKDDSVDVKQSAAKAVGRVVVAELEQQQTDCKSEGRTSLASLIPVIIALLGADQHSEVHRQILAVLRSVVGVDPKALEPHYFDLIPSMLSMIRDNSGTLKLSAERTLARVLQLDQNNSEAVDAYLASGKAGSLSKQILTETYVRRLGRLPVPEEDDLEDYAL